GPPAELTVYNAPPAKNPSIWLSADQNGEIATSVPGSGRRSSVSSRRSHSVEFADASTAPNATVRPSGETAGGAMFGVAFQSNLNPGGGEIENRTSAGGESAGRSATAAPATASAATTAAVAIHASARVRPRA